MKKRIRNEFIDLIRAEAEVAMRTGGMPSNVAHDIAIGLCERIMLRAGGAEHYVPQRDAALVRHQALSELGAGQSLRQVCARYGITRRTLQTWRQADTG
jgi:hypothetical protein